MYNNLFSFFTRPVMSQNYTMLINRYIHKGFLIKTLKTIVICNTHMITYLHKSKLPITRSYIESILKMDNNFICKKINKKQVYHVYSFCCFFPSRQNPELNHSSSIRNISCCLLIIVKHRSRALYLSVDRCPLI